LPVKSAIVYAISNRTYRNIIDRIRKNYHKVFKILLRQVISIVSIRHSSSSYFNSPVLAAAVRKSVRILRPNLFFAGGKIALEPSRFALPLKYQQVGNPGETREKTWWYAELTLTYVIPSPTLLFCDNGSVPWLMLLQESPSYKNRRRALRVPGLPDWVWHKPVHWIVCSRGKAEGHLTSHWPRVSKLSFRCLGCIPGTVCCFTPTVCKREFKWSAAAPAR
jgi:hypothetical protein